jgi:hypothetical protein
LLVTIFAVACKPGMESMDCPSLPVMEWVHPGAPRADSSAMKKRPASRGGDTRKVAEQLPNRRAAWPLDTTSVSEPCRPKRDDHQQHGVSRLERASFAAHRLT